MSRNIAEGTRCDRCHKDRVIKLVEDPRTITVEDTGSGMFDEFEGMLVAHAACWICGAKYLAWCDERPRVRPNGWSARVAEPVGRAYQVGGYFDLSYRSTFNDEPGEDDLPPYDPEAVEPLCTEALFLIERALKTVRDGRDKISTAQRYNLAKAEDELLRAWDCRNDQPQIDAETGEPLEGEGRALRSKTVKYSGTGATFNASLMTRGDLHIHTGDGTDSDGARIWVMPYHARHVLERELGAFVLEVLEARLAVLRQEGRLYDETVYGGPDGEA